MHFFFCPFVICQHTEHLFAKYTNLLDVPFWSILPAVCRFYYSYNHFLPDKIWFGRVLCSVNHHPAYPVPELGTKESKCAEGLLSFFSVRAGRIFETRKTLSGWYTETQTQNVFRKVFLAASLRTAISVFKECLSNAQSAVVAGVSQCIISTRILSTPSLSLPCNTVWIMLILGYWAELKYKI
jgi:hypothetical protein